MSLQRMQASLNDYQPQLLLLRHIYAFTLLMRGYHCHSKKKVVLYKCLFFFSPVNEENLPPILKENLSLLLEMEREMVYWNVSLVKAGQHLSLLLFHLYLFFLFF